MSAEDVFKVALQPYLVAIGDGERLYVARFEGAPTTSNEYQQIHDYVIDHRMVIDRTEDGPVEGMVYPTVRTWYKRSDEA